MTSRTDELTIAPLPELVRYLGLFRRWLVASQGYAANSDEQGVLLSAWIADALHNIPGMLGYYDPNGSWNSPEKLAAWIEWFPSVVRSHSAPEQIAADCERIFSPEDTAAELRLQGDLSNVDLAPPDKLAAYLDLLYHACLSIRWRPGSENPWQSPSRFWKERMRETARLMGRMAAVLQDVPIALVRWSEFDEERFNQEATAIWESWPRYFGLGRLAHQERQARLQARWIEPVVFGSKDRRASAVFSWLISQYSQPWRAYHDLSHIERMFLTWDELADEVSTDDARALTLAIWFHDAVYDPRQRDNEERSAEAAIVQLEPYHFNEETQARVQRMILATAVHQVEGGDKDTALLLDLDLAILGAQESDYDAYARAIRQEYGFVSEEDYHTGRTRVLRRFLERPRLYLTEPAFTRFEEQARRNLAREIAALQGGGRSDEDA